MKAAHAANGFVRPSIEICLLSKNIDWSMTEHFTESPFVLIACDQYEELDYMRGDPKEHKIKLVIKQLKNLGVDIYHQHLFPK